MAKANKQVQILVDGETEVTTSTKGWSPKECAGIPVLAQGWDAGSPTHHSISAGLALAAMAKVPNIKLGDFEAEDANGNQVLVPVYDPVALNEAMRDAFIEKYDLDVKTIRAAGNRTAATAKLSGIQSAFEDDPELLKMIQARNPELAAKLTK